MCMSQHPWGFRNSTVLAWTMAVSHHAVWKRHFFHIMQNEMNVTNRFTANQRKLESTQDQKIIAKRSGVVTCGKTTSDLMTAHLSKVFAPRAELTAVWFSTDTTCIFHCHQSVNPYTLPWGKRAWVLHKSRGLLLWRMSTLNPGPPRCKSAWFYSSTYQWDGDLIQSSIRICLVRRWLFTSRGKKKNHTLTQGQKRWLSWRGAPASTLTILSKRCVATLEAVLHRLCKCSHFRMHRGNIREQVGPLVGTVAFSLKCKRSPAYLLESKYRYVFICKPSFFWQNSHGLDGKCMR